jgi:tetratricopeptide (TPR) repeat protein
MIKTFLTLVAIFALQTGFCQDKQDRYIDSLQHELAVSNNDTMRFILLGKISDEYSEINPDSAFYYAEKVIPYAKRLQFKLEEATALAVMGYAQINLGNYPRSLEYFLSAIELASDPAVKKTWCRRATPLSMNFRPVKISPVAATYQIKQDLPGCGNSLWQPGQL